MYLPNHFAEPRIDLLHRLISEQPLGALVVSTADGLEANHLPFELDAEPAPLGTLRGHVARANPVWHQFSRGIEALVIFQGPQAYISPSWYPSKRISGEVVPTYNYLAVHGYGRLAIIHDRAWLGSLVTRLTERFESGRREPWRVSDAPGPFIEKQLAAIVGIEIQLTKLLGKWKVSQNRPSPDRAGVVAGLSDQNDADSSAIASWVKRKLES